MSRLTYGPRIPSSRKLLPSKYQRVVRNRSIIVNWGFTVDEFVEAMQRASDSMGRLMEAEANR